MEESQDSCNHIRICLGWNDPLCGSTICCLLCFEPDPRSSYNLIDAKNYKSALYGQGESSDARIMRLCEIQKLVVNLLTKNPNLTEEIVTKLNDIIEADVKKSFEKKLGHKFI